eukprot:m.3996 g.3996  ORF g.3996 m.3996 type:complete len:211 (+) comp2874_c0_seq1:122-754(+)
MAAPTDVNHAMRNILKLGDAETKTVTKMVDDFLQWASSDTDDGTSDSILQRLTTVQFSLLKQEQIVKMNNRESENYAAVSKELEVKIEQCKLDIETAKEGLKEAKGVRKHREEYDALASVILKMPSRQETIKEMNEMEKDISELTGESAKLETELQARQKQYSLLLYALRDIQRSLGMDGSAANKEQIPEAGEIKKERPESAEVEPMDES